MADTVNVEKAARLQKRRMLMLKRRIKVGAMLCAVLALVLYLLSAFVFFRIDKIEIAGQVNENGEAMQSSSYYTAEEIVRICGAEPGDSLVLVSKSEIKETIEKLLPYIGNVKVQRKYPSTLKLTVTDTAPAYAVDAGGGFTVMNSDYKVLDLREKVPYGCAKLVGVPVKNAETGETAEFADEAFKTRIDSLIKACDNAGVTNIKKIDLSNIANVRISFGGNVTLILGTLNDLDKKLEMGIKTMDTEMQNNPDGRIIIDVTEIDKSYVRDDYSPVDDDEEDSTVYMPVKDVVETQAVTEQLPENNEAENKEEIPEAEIEVPDAVG